MILAQLQRQEDRLQRQEDEQQQQIHEQKKEQQLLNEVLQDQIRELKHQFRREIKEQQHKIDKQQRENMGLSKIKRARRSDGDIEDHLKEFILNETKSLKQSILNETYALIDGLSQCQVGKNYADEEDGFNTR